MLTAFPSRNGERIERVCELLATIFGCPFSIIYDTLFRLSSHLPLRVHSFVVGFLDGIVDYSREFFAIGIMIAVITVEFTLGGQASRRKIKNLPNNIPSARVDHELALLIPRCLGWYQFTRELLSNMNPRYIVESLKCSMKYIKGARFLNSTPKEAAREYQFQKWAHQQNPKAPAGCVRLNLYSNLDNGRKRSLKSIDPDASIDLPFNRRDGSIDLSIARQKFGLDSLNIITDSEPFRTEFIPANEDRLSHIAIYTLSNQYQDPIRIFEPRVSKITSVSRSIRDPTFPILSFLVMLFRCLLGLPEQNTEYTRFMYGNRFATNYERIGQVMSFVRRLLGTICTGTLNFIAHYFILLPAYQLRRWGLATTRGGILAYRLLMETSKAILYFFEHSIAFCASVSLRAWFLSAAICYVVYVVGLSSCVMHAEYYAGDPSMVGPGSLLSIGFQTWFTTALAISLCCWMTQGLEAQF